jgi:hypothetical protein
MPLTAIYAAGVSTPLMGARGLHPSPQRAQIAAHAFFIPTVETGGSAHFTGNRDRPSAQGRSKTAQTERDAEKNPAYLLGFLPEGASTLPSVIWRLEGLEPGRQLLCSPLQPIQGLWQSSVL